MEHLLCLTQTMDHSGRISAREAFAYADDVHDSYDSPVYSTYGTDAGDQHLHQKWRYLFIYKDFVLKELRLLRDELVDPIRYQQAMRNKVLPALAELDDKLVVSPLNKEEAQKMISNIIRAAAK